MNRHADTVRRRGTIASLLAMAFAAAACVAAPATLPAAADAIEYVSEHRHAASLPVVLHLRVKLGEARDDIVYGPTDSPDASAYDLVLTGPDGAAKRVPLRNLKNDQGMMAIASRPAGATIDVYATAGRLPSGDYAASVANRAADVAASTPRPFAQRSIAPPVTCEPFRLIVAADDAGRAETLASLREGLDRAEPFFAAVAWTEDVPELREHLLTLLRDPTRSECRFAAWAFRRYGYSKRPADFDTTLAAAIAAADALPADRRNARVDAALMHLLQRHPQPPLLDTVIRWSRPGGAFDARDAAQMALQAYRADPQAVEAMAALLEDDGLALFAARCLADWRRDERALDVLERHAFMTEGQTSQPDVYFKYLSLYGKHPRVLDAIDRGLRDGRPAVREAAAKARAAVGVDPPAVPTKPAP